MRAEDSRADDGAETAFALWTQRGLHRLWDDVAKEPLPPDLLALIDAHRGKRPG